MRALRISLVKLIGLALLNFITIVATGQTESASSKKELEKRDEYKTRIYLSPLNLIDISGNSLQLTAGKSFREKSEIQFSIAQRLGGGDPFFVSNLYGGFVSGKFRRGTRIGLEFQKAFVRHRIFDAYSAMELAYSKDVIVFSDQTIERKRIIHNMKLGLKYFVGCNFLIDTYIGLGLKTSIDFKKVSLILPWNLKIGYQF